MTKDDVDDDDEEHVVDPGAWKPVTDESIKARRRVHVRRGGAAPEPEPAVEANATGASAAPSSNPFAGISLAAPTNASAAPSETSGFGALAAPAVGAVRYYDLWHSIVNEQTFFRLRQRKMLNRLQKAKTKSRRWDFVDWGSCHLSLLTHWGGRRLPRMLLPVYLLQEDSGPLHLETTRSQLYPQAASLLALASALVAAPLVGSELLARQAALSGAHLRVSMQCPCGHIWP